MSHQIKEIAQLAAKELKKHHIFLSGDKSFSPMVFNSANEEKSYRMTMDAEFNDPSNAVLSYQTSAYLNTFVRQITQKLAFDEIAKPLQQGNFETENFIIPTIAHQGFTSQYDDYTVAGQVGFTPNFPNRNVYRLQTTIQYGDLEVATWSAAKIDAISEKREAAALIINQDINTINFYGLQSFNGIVGKKVYGILTDPNLLPSIACPQRFKDSDAIQIIQFLQTMFSNISSRASNRVRVSSDQDIILAMTPQDETWFMTPNTLMTNSVYGYLKANLFPKLKIVTAIQYQVGDGSSGNKMQMIIPKINNQNTIRGLFTYRFKAHRVEVNSTNIQQVFSAGIGGELLALPALVETATGI
jgi:hypothetical protein